MSTFLWSLSFIIVSRCVIACATNTLAMCLAFTQEKKNLVLFCEAFDKTDEGEARSELILIVCLKKNKHKL